MAFDNPHNGSFNAAQIKISGNYVELELARILRDTLGNGWNVRQMALITVEGSNKLEEEENGIEMPVVIVSAMEDELMAHFKKTRPVIRKDIKELIDFGHFEKVYIHGSKRNKALRMTKEGYASWREYNERKAALYVAAGKTIEKLGGIPSFWMDTIRGTIKRFFKGTAGMIVASTLLVGSLLAPTSAQAWQLEEAYDPMSMVQEIDAASFLEQHLPKGAETSAWQGNEIAYDVSPAVNFVGWGM